MKKHSLLGAEWMKEGGEAGPGRRRGLVRPVEDGWVPVGRRWEVAGPELGNPKGLSARTVG